MGSIRHFYAGIEIDVKFYQCDNPEIAYLFTADVRHQGPDATNLCFNGATMQQSLGMAYYEVVNRAIAKLEEEWNEMHPPTDEELRPDLEKTDFAGIAEGVEDGTRLPVEDELSTTTESTSASYRLDLPD
jgi:hypothetical protein